MKTPRLIRLGGLGAMLGGLLLAAKAFHDRNDAPPWPTDATDTLFFVVPLLFLIGLAGLYARCRGRLREAESTMWLGAGAVGLAGSVVGHVTGMLEVGPAWWLGISWWMFVFGFFVVSLCLLFTGITVARFGPLPRWNGLPLAIGALGLLLILVGDAPNSDLGAYLTLAMWMLYGLGWTALGYVLVVGNRSLAVAGPGEPETNV